MNEAKATPDAGGNKHEDNTISPLPGEAGIPNVAEKPRRLLSRKGLFAAGLLIAALAAAAGITVERLGNGKKRGDADTKQVGDRPSAATAEPRKLDLTPPVAASAASAAAATRVPAIVPTADELAEPIGVRRTGSPTTSIRPEDAPVMIVSSPGAGQRAASTSAQRNAISDKSTSTSADATDPFDTTRQNLDAYQRQLHGVLSNLTQAAAATTAGQPAPLASLAPSLAGLATGAAAPGGLFGGQLQGSATPRVAASTLGNRSLTLPKGTSFTCALKTKVISATSGLVGCLVQRNVYSDDGRVLLIERGSHLDGEYRITSVKPGTVRIPVLWTRIRTPHGVTVDIDSPGTGPLGESGIDGYVDNRWSERIGAAMLLSLIDDSVKLIIQNQATERQGDTIILPSTTSNTSKLAEKVLDSTINIPPLVYQNQGGIVGIYVARDVDFSSVYELTPTTR